MAPSAKFTNKKKVAKKTPVKTNGKVVKKSNNINGKNKPIKKPVKATKLKTTLKNESKIVKAGSLAWKEVDVPENLGDYSGFFGLEEIDGVDVKIVNGQAEFIVKDDRKLKTEDQLEELEKSAGVFEDKKTKLDDENDDKMEVDEEEDEEAEQEDEEVEDNDNENEEDESDNDEADFTGFDDDADEDEEINEQAKDQSNDKPQSKSNTKKAKANQLNKPKDDDLSKTGFQFLDMPLPDDNDIDLPAWNDEENDLSLSPYTLSGLSALEYKKPTPIQRKTIPLALQGKDVVGKATTGSGKTLAYGIPILERYISKLTEIKSNINNKIINSPTGIIFAPTRELAHQVVEHLNKIAKYSPLSQHGIVSITGGLSIHKQLRLLNHGPGIIVATPGRFLEIIENNEETALRLSCTEILVLDEADRLLQTGHFEEFEKILEIFNKTRPKKDEKIPWKWQTLVFSATFSIELFGKLDKHIKQKENDNGGSLIDNDKILKLLAEKLKFRDSKPSLVDVNPSESVSGKITEALVECGPTERDLYLYYFLTMYSGSTLIFTNSIDSVKRLVPFFSNLQIPTFSIHSSMIQKQRLRAIERFTESTQKNPSSVLIASDIAARGLDIPNIDHVAHYHLPRSADVYIHRSGRTARAGKEGVSVMFCSPQEASGPLKKLRKIVANSSQKNSRLNAHHDVKLLPIDTDVVTQIKPRVSIAAKLADATVSQTSTHKEDTWVKQAAEDLGIDNLSDVDDLEDDFIKRTRKRKEGKMITKDESKRLRYELRQLLSTQLRKNHRRSYLTSGLENLAQQMVSGKTHKQILGHKDSNALDDLRKKKPNASKNDNKKNGDKKKDSNKKENKTSKNRNKNDLKKISKPVKK